MVRFGLVSFPVEAFNARSPEEAPIAFHQLHAECHSRIRYQKTCPVHGPISNDEIVSGYEVRKGEYVEIDPNELDELHTDGERALTIDAFVAPDEIDVIYFDGRMYYLSPDGEHAREPRSRPGANSRRLAAAVRRQPIRETGRGTSSKIPLRGYPPGPK